MAPRREPDLSFTFAHDTAAPATIRAMLNDRFDRSHPTTHDVKLVASELVTNVITHTSGGGELQLRIDGTRVRLDVFDHDRRPPRISPATGAQGGFGLRVVANASGEWGWNPTADGKAVWAEFDFRSGPDATAGESTAAGDRHPGLS